MDWNALLEGFSVALSPINLVWVLVGVVVGTVIGVLPGLGSTATIALLLPITYNMEPESAIIMLAGIYYGSMYGGTITSVLLRLPGEAASVVTALDGYEMAKRGQAGPALGISAVGSFVGGVVSVIGLFFLAPVCASFAVKFGPPEFAVLAAAGLLLACYLGNTSLLRSLISASLGLLLATVGRDPISGTGRFTFGDVNLGGGLDLVAVAMGLFGLGELIFNVTEKYKGRILTTKIGRVLPTRDQLRRSRGPIARGSVLGFILGVLPGGGGVVSSMASYATEKRLSRNREEFGKGAVEGVAGPETANNASSTSAFVPLLTLGIPSNVVMAVIYGALLLQGITPGPSLVNDHPGVFWGVIASMVVGNLILLVLNLPMVSVFVKLLRVRAGMLASFALVVTCIGAYSISNSIFDMYVLLAFGLLGYIMRLVGLEPAPLVLAFVLSPILEGAVRQSLLISGGSPDIFVTRPIAGTMVGLMLVFAVVAIVRRYRKKAQLGSAEQEPMTR
ncbi:tripartite tricarboxylate transporter permease [Prauserella oleivorans]|uniref:Tripartite tricarboxylate transporter permease n=1 Tax=Prauserella oleivorans TaxID=1478153 RepID=A0ABW5WAV5_9PSEU